MSDLEKQIVGYVTFQNQVYQSGHLFKVNHQFPFTGTQDIEVGCGCKGTAKENRKHYQVLKDNHIFLIDHKHVVETNVPIPEESQDFDVARRDQHRNAGIDDYDSIRVNNDPGRIWATASRLQPQDNFKH